MCLLSGGTAGVSPALYQVRGGREWSSGTPAVQRNNLTPGVAQCHIRIMSIIKRVCVYCGSSQGHDPRFVAAARRFGEILAAHRIGLVYGCGSIGLMVTIARALHDHSG